MVSITAVSTATRTVEDALYVSVGAGVLAVQSAQVRRRDLRARLDEQLGDAHQAVARVRTGADESLRVVEHQLDEVLGHVEERLPDAARSLLLKGRSVGAEAREAVHEMLQPNPVDGDDG